MKIFDYWVYDKKQFRLLHWHFKQTANHCLWLCSKFCEIFISQLLAFSVVVETSRWHHTLTCGQMTRQSMVIKMLALEVCIPLALYLSWVVRDKDSQHQQCWSIAVIFVTTVLTHTHPFNGPLSGTIPGWAGTRKVKPIWILLQQETVSGTGISWAICKSAPRSTTPGQQCWVCNSQGGQ